MEFIYEMILRFLNKMKVRHPKMLFVIAFFFAMLKAAVEQGYLDTAFGGTTPPQVKEYLGWAMLFGAMVIGVHTENAVKGLDEGKPVKLATKKK